MRTPVIRRISTIAILVLLFVSPGSNVTPGQKDAQSDEILVWIIRANMPTPRLILHSQLQTMARFMQLADGIMAQPLSSNSIILQLIPGAQRLVCRLRAPMQKQCRQITARVT